MKDYVETKYDENDLNHVAKDYLKKEIDKLFKNNANDFYIINIESLDKVFTFISQYPFIEVNKLVSNEVLKNNIVNFEYYTNKLLDEIINNVVVIYNKDKKGKDVLSAEEAGNIQTIKELKQKIDKVENKDKKAMISNALFESCIEYLHHKEYIKVTPLINLLYDNFRLTSFFDSLKIS